MDEVLNIDLTKFKEQLASLRREAFKPLPVLSLSEWADTHRRLSSEASAEPGQWRTSRAEYQRGIMDAISDRKNERIVVMSSSQIGKTEIILNLLAYFIHQEPSPILLTLPTVSIAQDYSKDRIYPLIRDCPALQDRIPTPTNRSEYQTVMHKRFIGGHLTLTGANAPSQLSSRPVRVFLADEVDRFPMSAGKEGDPVTLGVQRTSNFPGRKLVLVSTPTIKSFSRIEMEYDSSDQRRYYIECTNCYECFTPRWENVVYEDRNPETTRLKCPNCSYHMNERDKNIAVEKGHWRVTHPERNVVGFHVNAIISPWYRLEELVREWLLCQGRPHLLKVFVNTKLGEVYEEAGEGLSNVDLLSRRERYDAKSIPKGVILLTAGVDVQKNRIECEVVGWGAEEENWSVDYQVFFGDPATSQLWQTLKEYLLSTFHREDGVKLKVVAACVDTGGHWVQQAYSFCQLNAAKRWWPVKGMYGFRPIMPKKPSKSSTHKGAYVYGVGVDHAKEMIYRHLAIQNKGPGFCHFPEDRGDDYFTQLTSEKKKIYTDNQGKMKIAWVLPPRAQNEALDCRVYAYAAKVGLNPTLDAVERSNKAIHKKEIKKDERETEELINKTINEPFVKKPNKNRTLQRGNWVKNW